MDSVLTYETCRDLLQQAVVGRLAFVAPKGPVILPVNFAVDGEALVFRTTPYSELATHARDASVAFEVDHLDHEYHTGWSVLATGRLRVMENPDELALLGAGAHPEPWAEGTRRMYLRLEWDELTGRRIGTGWPHTRTPVQRQE